MLSKNSIKTILERRNTRNPEPCLTGYELGLQASINLGLGICHKRVGLLSFHLDTTKIISPDKICRVVNPCDPVPIIPVFPFVHATKSASEYLRPPTGKIGIDQHLLNAGYCRMAHMDAWSDLTTPRALDLMNQRELQAELAQLGGGTHLSAKALQCISNAIAQILKATGLAVACSLQMLGTLSLTAADMIAEMLVKAASFCKATAQKVIEIVQAILGFLGRAVIDVKNLHLGFLRWVLSTFALEMNTRALEAMNKARHQ